MDRRSTQDGKIDASEAKNPLTVAAILLKAHSGKTSKPMDMWVSQPPKTL